MTPGRRFFLLLYAASGAAALLYEVAWTRLLTLQLGHTVAAASTVLAAFMGGLAAGAAAAGRRATSDPQRGLRWYAALELAVAAFALILPYALRASVPLLAWAYDDGNAAARFGVIRIAISFLLVSIPAAAMGATYPIVVAWWARSASGAGALYAANTAGAAIGAVASGFWLVPAAGLRATTWIGMAINVAVAAGAWRLADSTAHSAPESSTVDRSARPRGVTSKRTPAGVPSTAIAISVAAVSGFAALVYEVAWTRLLALVIGPTTYAFATMAAGFIGGLAIGSTIGSWLAERVRRPAVWLASALAIGAVAAFASATFAATRMPLLVGAQVADPAVEFGRVVLSQAAGVSVVLLPMTLALGAAFPLALAVAGGEGLARETARVYTANTIGAIAGALTAGFILIPNVGLRVTFEITALASAIVAAATLAISLAPAPGAIAETAVVGGNDRRSRRRSKERPSKDDTLPRSDVRRSVEPFAMRWPAAIAVLIVSAAAIVLQPRWDRALLASGAYKYAPYLNAADLDAVLRAGEINYYKEGAAGTVSVRDLTGTRSLAIDGKVDASNAGDMLTQRLLGLLPVMLHDNAEDVCVIGLGSGVTVGSALAPGTVRHADVVEISPEVVEASRFFDQESGRALDQPGVRLIVGDGRSHLLLTRRRYDVIVSEPSNPWMAGVAALFTREFFEGARAALKPDGLLCQWAHTYDIGPDDLRGIVRTFASVFPQGTMWLVGDSDLLLVGTKGEDISSRLAALARHATRGRTGATLATVGVKDGTAAFALTSLFSGGPDAIARYAAAGRIETDDRTQLEYSAPRWIYGRTATDNAADIRAVAADPPAAVKTVIAKGSDTDWTSRGQMELKAEAFGAAYDAFQRAATMNARNIEALAGVSNAAAGAHRQPEARQWLERLSQSEPANAAVRVELSRVLAASGDLAAAADRASDALQLEPDNPAAAEQLASVLADAGDAARLEPLSQAMMTRFPDRVEPRFYYATALFLRGRTEDALTAARQVVDVRPTHARAQNLLGAACATLGRTDCARAAFAASLRANPRDPATYVNAGTLDLQAGDAVAAAANFASALAVDPSSTAAHDGLARARELFGSRRE